MNSQIEVVDSEAVLGETARIYVQGRDADGVPAAITTPVVQILNGTTVLGAAPVLSAVGGVTGLYYAEQAVGAPDFGAGNRYLIHVTGTIGGQAKAGNGNLDVV